TSCASASRSPSVRPVLADPNENAPPCNHTITGRLPTGAGLGVQTFSVKQSSLSGDGSAAPEKSASSGRPAAREVDCGDFAVYSVASRTPLHDATFWGG